MTRASEYNKPVVIQRSEGSQDEFGEETLVWTTLINLGARVISLMDKDKVAAGRDITDNLIRIDIRFNNSDITTSDRVFFNGYTWDIITIDPFDFTGKSTRLIARRQS